MLRKDLWANMVEAAVENKEIDFLVDADESEPLLPPPEKETSCESVSVQYIPGPSKRYFSIVLLISIALPLSAVYMGMANEYQCPVSKVPKTLLTILGLLGCFITILFIVKLISRVRGNVSHQLYLIIIIVTVTLLVFLLLLGEAVAFFKISPDFDISSKNYWAKRSYDYVYYSNFIAIGISILMTMLYFPCSSFWLLSHRFQ
ncbi:hypothetical protein NPIL_65151 [Nephila pilipes]|uniref:Uncharacterized protein n=1 Tax=Nephila pilipes TaxID=299642 RepID=A0A8X6IZN6_NEPPI|nr:hypothetical protein NPIL_65151 [Nephila pilipes]